ncbi:Nucleotidyltransferase, partial [Phlegmacium glaucopus]
QLRLTVKHRVELAIRHHFGSRFHVEFFGSIHYGVSHPNSDLDLVVIDPQLPQGFERLHKLGGPTSATFLTWGTVAFALSRFGFTSITPRAKASVPIVKFRDPVSGLDCDLNINDRLGIFNSDMVKQYCDAYPLLRPLLYRIKEWAKPLGLNSPSPPRGPISFSSYALTLMTIGFLQKEGHLPNLQENLPPLLKHEKNNSLIWTRKPHQVWDVRFNSAKDWVPPPLPDFDTLLCSWFSFWINFPYDTESISIRHGGTIPRTFKSKAPIPPISVMDPFIVSKNVSTSISKRTLERFKSECSSAVR